MSTIIEQVAQCYIQGLTISETADHLNISRSHVGNARTMARRRGLIDKAKPSNGVTSTASGPTDGTTLDRLNSLIDRIETALATLVEDAREARARESVVDDQIEGLRNRLQRLETARVKKRWNGGAPSRTRIREGRHQQSEQERTAIDKAIADGRVTRCPDGFADGAIKTQYEDIG